MAENEEQSGIDVAIDKCEAKFRGYLAKGWQFEVAHKKGDVEGVVTTPSKMKFDIGAVLYNTPKQFLGYSDGRPADNSGHCDEISGENVSEIIMNLENYVQMAVSRQKPLLPEFKPWVDPNDKPTDKQTA